MRVKLKISFYLDAESTDFQSSDMNLNSSNSLLNPNDNKGNIFEDHLHDHSVCRQCTKINREICRFRINMELSMNSILNSCLTNTDICKNKLFFSPLYRGGERAFIYQPSDANNGQ